jgi:speckle-type POZ protein
MARASGLAGSPRQAATGMCSTTPTVGNRRTKSTILFLLTRSPEAVKTQANISLLDQDGEPVPAYSHTTNIGHLTENKCVGFGRFIKRQVLEKSEHLKDDSFTVRLKVTVF